MVVLASSYTGYCWHKKYSTGKLKLGTIFWCGASHLYIKASRQCTQSQKCRLLKTAHNLHAASLQAEVMSPFHTDQIHLGDAHASVWGLSDHKDCTALELCILSWWSLNCYRKKPADSNWTLSQRITPPSQNLFCMPEKPFQFTHFLQEGLRGKAACSVFLMFSIKRKWFSLPQICTPLGFTPNDSALGARSR